MEENLLYKLQGLNESGCLLAVDKYCSGETGIFDIASEYYDIDQIRYSDNKIADICNVSMEIARNHIDEIREGAKTEGVSEKELLLYLAWKIAKQIKHQEDKHFALLQGENYADSSEKIEYYETKNRAYNKGYDQYIEDNISSGVEYLDCLINTYENNTKGSK